MKQYHPELWAQGKVRVLYMTGPVVGKGGKVEYGMKYAIHDGPDHQAADIAGYTDADTTTDPRLYGLLIRPMINEDGSLKSFAALGSRVPPKGALAVPDVPTTPEGDIGKVGVNIRKRFLLPGMTIIDTQCGFKAFTKDLLEKILPE